MDLSDLLGLNSFYKRSKFRLTEKFLKSNNFSKQIGILKLSEKIRFQRSCYLNELI